MKILSQTISWVFMPLFMPIYALLLVMYVPAQEELFYGLDCPDCVYLLDFQIKKALFYMFGIFCVIAPGFSFMLLKRSGVINTLEMETRAERTVPIIIMFIYCLGLFLLMSYTAKGSNLPKFVYSLPLSGAVVTGLFIALNQWKKISIHAASAGIFTGFILAYLAVNMKFGIGMLLVSILLSGVVMSARLNLQKHTLLELTLGWFSATLFTFVVNYFY